jgi:hypothetical protein
VYNCIDTLHDRVVASIKFIVFDDYRFDSVGMDWKDGFKVVSFRNAADDGADGVLLKLTMNCSGYIIKKRFDDPSANEPCPTGNKSKFSRRHVGNDQNSIAEHERPLIYILGGISNINLDERRHEDLVRNMPNCVFAVCGEVITKYHRAVSPKPFLMT